MPWETLERLVNGECLSAEEARAMMSKLMSGDLHECEIAAVLVALRVRGETVDEIAGFATAMRQKAIRIAPKRTGLVDTCGTGGDGRQTFNISTAAALLAAAMDIPIAKHGNRAVSSRCGSADVLEALGVNIALAPERVAELIDRVGIGFLFAPQHHPAMKHAAPVRLLGVFRPDLTETVCNVLHALGAEKARVVHGLDGTDEVSITGDTIVSALEGGAVRTFRFSPEDAGLSRVDLDAISGGSAEENAAHIRSILSGCNGPRSDAVLLNAGFVAVVADRAPDVATGVELARDTIQSGRAFELLTELRETSHLLGEDEA
jgi:anthranilate phosphoribosyltransferase